MMQILRVWVYFVAWEQHGTQNIKNVSEYQTNRLQLMVLGSRMENKRTLPLDLKGTSRHLMIQTVHTRMFQKRSMLKDSYL